MSGEKFNQMNKALVHWEEMIEDIERLTREYEESGWRTLVLHPGDVSTATEETENRKAGFRLVVPDSELDALAEMVEAREGTYDEFEVHRAPTDDFLLFVVILKSVDLDRAVFYPVYYDPDANQRFVEILYESDAIYTSITNLSKGRVFSFSHGKPALFSP